MAIFLLIFFKNYAISYIMSFRKVRSAHKTENTEDYLELIAELHNTNGEARIVDIAKRLGIAQATANKTIQRLQAQGYIKREPYRSLFLTLKRYALNQQYDERKPKTLKTLRLLSQYSDFLENVIYNDS